jgi:hypothetical protein
MSEINFIITKKKTSNHSSINGWMSIHTFYFRLVNEEKESDKTNVQS